MGFEWVLKWYFHRDVFHFLTYPWSVSLQSVTLSDLENLAIGGVFLVDCPTQLTRHHFAFVFASWVRTQYRDAASKWHSALSAHSSDRVRVYQSANLALEFEDQMRTNILKTFERGQRGRRLQNNSKEKNVNSFTSLPISGSRNPGLKTIHQLFQSQKIPQPGSEDSPTNQTALGKNERFVPVPIFVFFKKVWNLNTHALPQHCDDDRFIIAPMLQSKCQFCRHHHHLKTLEKSNWQELPEGDAKGSQAEKVVSSFVSDPPPPSHRSQERPHPRAAGTPQEWLTLLTQDSPGYPGLTHPLPPAPLHLSWPG